jgi:hypothetical protein
MGTVLKVLAMRATFLFFYVRFSDKYKESIFDSQILENSSPFNVFCTLEGSLYQPVSGSECLQICQVLFIHKKGCFLKASLTLCVKGQKQYTNE